LGPFATLFRVAAKNEKLILAYSSSPNNNEIILGMSTCLYVASDVSDHSSLNVVHLLELMDQNEAVPPSSKNMSVIQSTNTVDSKSLSLHNKEIDDCLFKEFPKTLNTDKSSNFEVFTDENRDRYNVTIHSPTPL